MYFIFSGEDCICKANIVPIYECYLTAMKDYTHDRRGDIGAWVREAAMSGLASLTLAVTSTEPSLVPQVCIEAMMPKIAQQALEKIDRTRGHAAHLFATILTNSEPVPHIPRKSELLSYFPQKIRVRGSDFDEFGWSVESETFPIFVKLLRLPEFSEFAVIGLMASVGGVTERLVRQSSISLFKELEIMKKAELEQFVNNILTIFLQNQKVDRITLPGMKFLDSILNSGWLEPILSSDLSFDIFSVVKTEITKCGEPNKLVHSVDVFCALLQSKNPTTVNKCLIQLSIFLCHKFPRIRKVTAQKIFETLLIFDDIIQDEETTEQVNGILSDTNWDSQLEEIRPIRNRFCELVGVQPPALIKKPL
jgi:hypothetical protein